MPDSLVSMFRKEIRAAEKQAKSDDILDFIKKNWKLFASSKRHVEDLCEELQQRGDLSVTALAEALGIPDCVFFKKIKVVDTAKFMLRASRSPLLALFNKTVEERSQAGHATPELCLFLVAGEHSLVLTNMITRRVPGGCQLLLTSESGDSDIHVFGYTDAPARLPALFGNKED